jgi:hypothetical protein
MTRGKHCERGGFPVPGSIGLPELLVMLVVWAFSAFCFIKITKRLGFNPAWGVLAVVPLCQIAWMIYIAFAKWPHESS